MRNYSSVKLEFLSLYWVVTKKFRDYLYGSLYMVKTDSHPLSPILTTEHTAADMSNLPDLLDFNFTINTRKDSATLQLKLSVEIPLICYLMVVMLMMMSYVSCNLNGTKTLPLPDKLVSVIGDCSYSEELRAIVHETSIICVPVISETDMSLLQNTDPHISLVMQMVEKQTPATMSKVKTPTVLIKHLGNTVIELC